MISFLRYLFFLLIVRPIVLVIIGMNIRHAERLPRSGPAILVANHNSHLDTLVLMTLFPMRLLPDIHPVAAADYFLGHRLRSWFFLHLIGIIPIQRHTLSPHEDPLHACANALEQNSILIFFPEGTRGEPEHLSKFKTGIAHLAKRYPQVPLVPVFLHGLGKVLPKGEALLVPFFCDVFVGEPLNWNGDRLRFMDALDQRMKALFEEGNFAPWE